MRDGLIESDERQAPAPVKLVGPDVPSPVPMDKLNSFAPRPAGA
jgi:hypothetical protein